MNDQLSTVLLDPAQQSLTEVPSAQNLTLRTDARHASGPTSIEAGRAVVDSGVHCERGDGQLRVQARMRYARSLTCADGNTFAKAPKRMLLCNACDDMRREIIGISSRRSLGSIGRLGIVKRDRLLSVATACQTVIAVSKRDTLIVGPDAGHIRDTLHPGNDTMRIVILPARSRRHVVGCAPESLTIIVGMRLLDHVSLTLDVLGHRGRDALAMVTQMCSGQPCNTELVNHNSPRSSDNASCL